MKKITREQAVEMIRETNGAFFTVHFYKINGEERTMNARLGVKKHLAGGELKFSPSEKGLISVFDVQSKGYRFINMRTIFALTIGKKNYLVG